MSDFSIHIMGVEIPVEFVANRAELPRRGSPNAAGLDLIACETVNLRRQARAVVRTGVKMAIPEGYFGSIRGRSGLAVKHGIDVLAGVIDSDYRGEIGVVLINHGERMLEIKPGMAIAQMIIQPYATAKCFMGELDETVRGENGFGSTGA